MPGASLMIRKRTTPSVIRSVRCRFASSAGGPWNWSRWYSASVLWWISYARARGPSRVLDDRARRSTIVARRRRGPSRAGPRGARVEQQHEVVEGFRCSHGKFADRWTAAADDSRGRSRGAARLAAAMGPDGVWRRIRWGNVGPARRARRARAAGRRLAAPGAVARRGCPPPAAVPVATARDRGARPRAGAAPDAGAKRPRRRARRAPAGGASTATGSERRDAPKPAGARPQRSTRRHATARRAPQREPPPRRAPPATRAPPPGATRRAPRPAARRRRSQRVRPPADRALA